MKINSKDFRVREGDEINHKKWPTKPNECKVRELLSILKWLAK